jgi:hypothetical protein
MEPSVAVEPFKETGAVLGDVPVVATIFKLAATGVDDDAVGANCRVMVHVLPVVAGRPAEQSPDVDGTTENGPEGETADVIALIAAVPVFVTVNVCVALRPTTTVPKPSEVAGVVVVPTVTVAVCPKAAAATKRRTPTICAGILNIEFLK